ncbi:hypothetical protein [Candidatus Enterovibrio altilux]|uniref:hypothetical protein n=1 Tax=Candidatus Enterovibrio altilux TaxID=1927128 RepID=UPI001237AF8C
MKILFHYLGKQAASQKRSLSKAVMFQVKKLLVGTLSLRNHTTQISETDSIIEALNKLTELSIPNTKAIV